MMTNAQAALLAACTQFAGADADPDPGTVQGLAAKYKGWLDRKDKEDKEYLAQQATPTPPRQLLPQYSTGGVDPLPVERRLRHISGNLSDTTTTCPECQQGPGQSCVTVDGSKLRHGHLIPVENFKV